MANLSNEELNKIRNSVNIVDVVSNYISLTKRGKNYFGVCPFHEDSDPSLSVSEEKQIFSCFSSKKCSHLSFILIPPTFVF